jgi:hypothetical protein
MHNTSLVSSSFFRARLTAICLLFSSLFLLLSCTAPSSEQYGFVATLGNDTVSVESITRQGNKLTSDEVDRFPRVQIRHTVVTLNDDGSVRHLVMDIHTPSETAGQQHRQVVADVANNKVHLSKTDSTSTYNRDFATGGSMVVAHVPQMYSLYELYFVAAMKKAEASKLAPGTPVEMRQFYIDREFDRFPLGRATVTLLGGGKAEVYHDWLSGTGDAVIDSNYHLLSYSGNRTTYKVQVKRLNEVPDITGITNRFTATETKDGHLKSLSVRDTVHAQIGDAQFTVDYGRPLLRGRILLGDVIPYDYVWRTGANAATQLTTSALIKIAGLKVPAGRYTLWTAPHTTGVDLIVNKQSGQWGTEYNRGLNLGETRMTSEAVTTPVEQFTISIISKDAVHGTLVMEWGSFRWTAAIEVMK